MFCGQWMSVFVMCFCIGDDLIGLCVFVIERKITNDETSYGNWQHNISTNNVNTKFYFGIDLSKECQTKAQFCHKENVINGSIIVVILCTKAS